MCKYLNCCIVGLKRQQLNCINCLINRQFFANFVVFLMVNKSLSQWTLYIGLYWVNIVTDICKKFTPKYTFARLFRASVLLI
jgi:hypothetical protein